VSSFGSLISRLLRRSVLSFHALIGQSQKPFKGNRFCSQAARGERQKKPPTSLIFFDFPLFTILRIGAFLCLISLALKPQSYSRPCRPARSRTHPQSQPVAASGLGKTISTRNAFASLSLKVYCGRILFSKTLQNVPSVQTGCLSKSMKGFSRIGFIR